MSNVNVQNAMFDSTASQQGLTKAADRIVKAIGAGDKTSQKIIETIKTGTEKIVDSVNKVRTTNNAGQPTPVAIAAGLTSIAESATKTAHHLRTHPGEMKTAADTMTSVGQQMTDLTDCARQAAENGMRLRAAVGEAAKTADWVGGQYCGGGVTVNNSFGRVVTSFGDLFTG